MATQGLGIDNSNLFANLLMNFLGGQSSQDQAGEQHSQTGSDSTNTTTGTTTTTGTSTSNTTADISRLMEVYNRDAAGVTPDMMKAIFKEGSKEIPGLTTAFANAVGGRTAENSGLGMALGDLNSRITGKVADINQQMLTQAGQVAAQIGDLTKSTTTTSSNTQVQDLLNRIIGNTSTDQTNKGSSDSETSLNTQKLLQALLGGQLLGGLDGLLGGGEGGSGGGLGGLISGAGSWIKDLFGKDWSGIGGATEPGLGGYSDVLANQDWGDILGSGTDGTDWSSVFNGDWANGDWWSEIASLWGG